MATPLRKHKEQETNPSVGPQEPMRQISQRGIPKLTQESRGEESVSDDIEGELAAMEANDAYEGDEEGGEAQKVQAHRAPWSICRSSGGG